MTGLRKELKIVIKNSDINKLTDAEIYFILYLKRVEALSLHQLEEQFSLCRDSVEKIVQGRTRKKCYAGYMAIEKYLGRTA